nr:MAG TPA: putative peptidoglycan binding domain protein [Caudoviricetes sp.]
MIKTGKGLVEYAKAQLGKPYWYGTFGQTANAGLLAAKRQQYPGYYTAGDFPAQFGQKVHDCVGLIKGFLWCDTPDSEPIYKAAQDVAVSGLFMACPESGSIGTMPDIPGVCVFMRDMSHVGVYIGNGYVVEATGHARGVVKSKLAGRGWGLWGKPRWISYEAAATPAQPAQTTTQSTASTLTVTGLPLLRYGGKGEYVRSAQLLLIGRGYSCGRCGADGEMGQDTYNAIIAFQRASGLQQDGIIGAQTWARLIGG